MPQKREFKQRPASLSRNLEKKTGVQTPLVSVVVPCYNEQDVLRECHAQLSQALEASCGASYELIYVNDGSKDGTEEILRALHASSPQVRAIMLSRNFGHQAAVTAGLAGSTGRCAIIIDADLQDPPEVIPQMLDRWRQGFEVVYGVRESREGESGFKIRSAQLFYRLINRLSNIEIPLDSGDFRLLDRRAIDALLSMPERHRLLRGMSSWIGFRQFGLRYARAARFAGATKYPISKMLALALDGILSFSTVPLRFVTGLGFLTAAVAAGGIFYSLAVRVFTSHWVAGWATLILAVLFIGGVEMFCLGILGEYIGRIYTETKQRPLFLVREVLESGAASADAILILDEQNRTA